MKDFAISIFTTDKPIVKYTVSARIQAKNEFQALLKFVRILKNESPNIKLTKVYYLN